MSVGIEATESQQRSAPASRVPRWLDSWPIAALFALAFVAWRFVLDLPLVGVDVWPILLQAQLCLESPSLLFEQGYLHGQWDGGVFWRPGFTLAAALQWSVFGETPLPYQVLRICAYGLAACQAGWFAARVSKLPRSAFLLAGSFFLLHPVQASMLPSAARAADVLCECLIAAGLLLLSSKRVRWQPLLGTGCILLAPFVKETGLLAPPLAILLVWAGGTGMASKRLRFFLGALALGFSAHLALRFAAIGGLGGYATSAVAVSPLLNTERLLTSLANRESFGIALGLLLCLTTTTCIGLAKAPAQAEESHELPSKRVMLLVLVLWALAVCVGGALSARINERHASSLLLPIAALIGASLGNGHGARTARARVLICAQVGTVILLLAPHSPLTTDYPQWRIAGRANQLFFKALERGLERTQKNPKAVRVPFGKLAVNVLPQEDGNWTIVGEPLPRMVEPPNQAGSAKIASPMVLEPYSVQAWMLLHDYGPDPIVRPGDYPDKLQESDLGPVGPVQILR